MARTKVFISYSQKDRPWLEALTKHIKPLERQGDIDPWDDRRIAAGDLWRDEIKKALDAAAVGVLLVSPDFLASDFIAKTEVPTLLDAAFTAGTPILCLYVVASVADVCRYEYFDRTGAKRTRRLTEFQGLNDPSRPLAKRSVPRDEVLARAAITIRDAAARSAAPSVQVRPLEDPHPYLERLRADTRYLALEGLRDKQAPRIELTRVYTRLRVAPPVDPNADVSDPRLSKRALDDDDAAEVDSRQDFELKDLLGKHAHLVLVGDPGAGKTTFLRFTALNLANAWLNEEREVSLARLGWAGAPAFPVFCSLGAFGQFLETNPSSASPTDAAEHFYRYLDFVARARHPELPATFLRERVLAGGTLLLLDGLDEVPGDARCQQVGKIVDEVVAQGRARGNRHLVTCRTRQYHELMPLGADFVRATLVDFGPKEVEAFVRQWSEALHRGQPGRPHDGAGRVHAEALLAALRAHPHVQPLTTNPLLLTIVAIVHSTEEAGLPEGRASLYKQAIERLLRDRDEVGQRVGRPMASRRRRCLSQIAVRMFEDPAGVRTKLGRAEAARVVAPVLGIDVDDALKFVEDEELHSGILVSRDQREVEFWHPTSGEYFVAEALAAEWLASADGGWERVRPRLFDDRWNEVLLLFAGELCSLGSGEIRLFIRRIVELPGGLGERARAVGLVGRILRDIAHAGGEPTLGTGYAEALAEMPDIFKPGSDVPERVRFEVGEALGQAGDPRIHDDDLQNRVWIEGGTFLMGAQDKRGARGHDADAFGDEGPPHEVTLSPYWVDRYAVTVQKFRRFVEAGAEGYLAQRFWTAEGWKWWRLDSRTEPRAWADQVRHANRPVIYVSWYEAVAYCAWLSARHVGWRVQLPTEAQWEYAARGREGRKYPWGGEKPSDERASFAMRIGGPTPVGIYPLGGTPEGVHDLAGNVREWCADWFGRYETTSEPDPGGPPNGTYHVLRGGAFNDGPRGLRAAYRLNWLAGDDDLVVGFRCVWVVGGRTA